MAKREDFSQNVDSTGTGNGSGAAASSGLTLGKPEPLVIQLAQGTTTSGDGGSGGTGGNAQLFDLANAPVKATFTSTEVGTRIELPPGTTIDQVFISGLNLYLVQPDGSVVVIIGGALNYPTLEFAPGVTITSDQLAEALQNAQEGVPTAGPDDGGPDSGGGNFAVDPGPIGGPFDLFDLLPPTHLIFGLFPRDDETEELDEEIGDTAPLIGLPEMVALEEDDLEKGNDEDGSAPTRTMAMGRLAVSFGEDGPGAIVFDPGTEAPENLTSNGGKVIYQLFNGGTVLVAFVDKDGSGEFEGDLSSIGVTLDGTPPSPTLSVFRDKEPEPEVMDCPVFVIEISQDFGLNPDGKYTVWLLDNIDHNEPTKDGEDGTTEGLPATGDLSPENIENLKDEELEFLNFEFIATDGDGTPATGEFMVKVQDDIPHIDLPNNEKCIKFELEKGVVIEREEEPEEPRGEEQFIQTYDGPSDGPNPSDLLYEIPEGTKKLHIKITDLMSDAGFENALGYYFADVDGNPLGGFIMEDNAKSDDEEEAWIMNIPEGAFMLGFFILPDANDLQSLSEDIPVFFKQDENGFWQAFFNESDENPIQTAHDYVLFSDRRLNPDIDPDGNTEPGDDFEKMGPNHHFSKDSNWEDRVEDSDKDFNDVQFNITVTADVLVEYLMQVDEDDINNFDKFFDYYDHDGIEGSKGTSPNDGDHDGSVTGHPAWHKYGPAVAHGDLGIWWGADNGNMEESEPGRPWSDNDGTEFFEADNTTVDDGDDVISFFGSFFGYGHDFEQGEKVIYTTDDPSNPGTYIPGLTPGAYYVITNDVNGSLNSNQIQLALTAEDAANGIAVDITGEFAGGVQFIHKAGDRSVVFDSAHDNVDATHWNGEALMSKGEQVIYRLSDDGTKLIAFVDGPGYYGDFDVRTVQDSINNEKNSGDRMFDWSGESGDRLVFIVELSDLGNGEAWFKLYDQIDHFDPGVGNMGKAVEDLTWLKFNFIATDSDGDMVMDTFTVDVKDDVPMLTGKDVWKIVDEDDIDTFGDGIPGGSHGTSPDDGAHYDGSFTGNPFIENGDNPHYAEGPAAVFGSVAHTVKFGADEPGMFTFSDKAVEKFLNLGLLSKGEDISYQVVENEYGFTLIGFVNDGGSIGQSYDPENDDRLVFQFHLSKDGFFAFKLFDQMDHDKPDYGADENFDLQDDIKGDVRELDFGDVIKATDFDGDSILLKDQVHIKIRDDIPELKDDRSVMLTVDEDDINNFDPDHNDDEDGIEGSMGTSPNDGTADGSETGNPASNDFGPAMVMANLSGLVKVGADEHATFMLINSSSARNFLEGLGLESKGESISFDFDGNMLIGFVNIGGQPGASSFDPENGDRLVFKLTVDSDGKVTYEQFDQMDHDPPYDIDPSGFPSGDDPNFPGNSDMADQNTDLIDNDDPDNPPRDFDITKINFGKIIKAVDFDGDAVTLDGVFGVTIRDDIPKLLDTMVMGQVSEEALNGDPEPEICPHFIRISQPNFSGDGFDDHAFDKSSIKVLVNGVEVPITIVTGGSAVEETFDGRLSLHLDGNGPRFFDIQFDAPAGAAIEVQYEHRTGESPDANEGVLIDLYVKGDFTETLADFTNHHDYKGQEGWQSDSAGKEADPICLAMTSFENELVINADFIGPAASGDIVNTAGQPIVDSTASSATAGDLGFDARWTSAGGSGASNNMTDGAPIGVTDDQSLTGNNSYRISDTDGFLGISFDPVDVSGATGAKVSLSYYVEPAGYEGNDFLEIFLSTDQGGIPILFIDGDDIDDTNTVPEGQWINVMVDIPDAATTATLVVNARTSADNEAFHIDDIKFTAESVDTGGGAMTTVDLAPLVKVGADENENGGAIFALKDVTGDQTDVTGAAVHIDVFFGGGDTPTNQHDDVISNSDTYVNGNINSVEFGGTGFDIDSGKITFLSPFADAATDPVLPGSIVRISSTDFDYTGALLVGGGNVTPAPVVTVVDGDIVIELGGRTLEQFTSTFMINTTTLPVINTQNGPLTSMGEFVHFTDFEEGADYTLLTAKTQSGDTVFTLRLSEDGEAKFTLFKDLDHGDLDLLELDLGPFVNASDFDHDTIMLGNGQFIVKVENADPIIAGAFMGTVEEEHLFETVIDDEPHPFATIVNGNEDVEDADGKDTDEGNFNNVTNLTAGNFSVSGGDGNFDFSFVTGLNDTKMSWSPVAAI